MYFVCKLNSITLFAFSLFGIIAIHTPSMYAQVENNHLSSAQELGIIKSPNLQDINWGFGRILNAEREDSEAQNLLIPENNESNLNNDFEENWTTTGDKKSTGAAIPVLNF